MNSKAKFIERRIRNGFIFLAVAVAFSACAKSGSGSLFYGQWEPNRRINTYFDPYQNLTIADSSYVFPSGTYRFNQNGKLYLNDQFYENFQLFSDTAYVIENMGRYSISHLTKDTLITRGITDEKIQIFDPQTQGFYILAPVTYQDIIYIRVR